MPQAPSLPRLHSPPLLLPFACPTSLQEINDRQSRIHASERLILIKTRFLFFPPLFLLPKSRIRTVCLESDVTINFQVVAISVGFASVAVGIGIPVFYETQIDSAAKRDNTQPCFPCNGTGAQKCRFCTGSGTVTVEIGGGEKEVSNCINCEGVGLFTCTTCQGSRIQPRYLDRREFKDDD